MSIPRHAPPDVARGPHRGTRRPSAEPAARCRALFQSTPEPADMTWKLSGVARQTSAAVRDENAGLNWKGCREFYDYC